MHLIVVLRIFLGLAAIPLLAPSASAQPKLIIIDTASDSSGDAADPVNLVRNASFIDTTGLDGVVANTQAGWDLMLPGRVLNYITVYNQLSPMKGRFNNATSNFILTYIQKVDPFDDWTQIINNWVTLALAARDAGMMGFVFDNEPYNGDPWMYPKVKYGATKTRTQYREQFRQQGKSLMNALAAVWPGMRFIVLNGPYTSDRRTPDSIVLDQSPVTENDLSGFFFAGLLAAAPSTARVIDGGEVYQYRTAADFQNSYQWRKYTLPSLTPSALVPASLQPLWSTKIDISFGVFDEQWIPEYPMNLSIFESTLTNALKRADSYVWVYAEQHNYLKAGGVSTDWLAALKRAKVAANASRSVALLGLRSGR